jgi:hypothetical protein
MVTRREKEWGDRDFHFYILWQPFFALSLSLSLYPSQYTWTVEPSLLLAPTNENWMSKTHLLCFLLLVIFIVFSFMLRFYSSLQQKKRDKHISCFSQQWFFFSSIMIIFSLKWGFLFFSFWTEWGFQAVTEINVKLLQNPELLWLWKKVSDSYNEDHFGWDNKRLHWCFSNSCIVHIH